MNKYNINNPPEELGIYALVVSSSNSQEKQYIIARFAFNNLLHRNDFFHRDFDMIIPPCVIEKYIKLDVE